MRTPPSAPLLRWFPWLLLLVRLVATSASALDVQLADNRFSLDGHVTDLWGVRVASASQTDALTDQLIAHLDEYRSYGINAVTVFFQGSNGACSDPFNAEGTAIDPAHLARMQQIIRACDARGIVVIVGVFYQIKAVAGVVPPVHLRDWNACLEAVRTTTRALREHRNIIFNIANEQNSPGHNAHPWAKVRTAAGIIEACEVAREEDPARLVGGGGYDHAINLEIGRSSAVDVLLFDTLGPNRQKHAGHWFDHFVANGVTGKPIVSVEMFGNWTGQFKPAGVYPSDARQAHFQEIEDALARPGLSVFLHSNNWFQGGADGGENRYDLGGLGTAEDPGMRWYFEYLRAAVASHSSISADDVTPYDWSHASPASERYRVTVNGRPVFVGDFWSEHFAQFEFTGRAEVEVTFLPGAIDPALTAVSPKSWNIPYAIESDRLRFTIERPKQYVIRINEPLRPAVSLNYLFLFAEAPEANAPEAGAPGVIDVTAAGIDATGTTDVTAALARLIDEAPAGSVVHFPRGTYAIEDLVIRRPGATLHLAPGAFLHAQLPGNRATRRRALSVIEAPGVTIRGRGLIEAKGYAVTIEKSPDLVIEDVMIRSDAIGKQGVTPAGNEDGGRGLILGHSNRYRLTNLKILTVMDQEIGKGKDGMNLASSSDALVEHCFAIAGDDIYTIKGRHDPREWISVDLGVSTPLLRVVTKWGAGYWGRFLVEVSDDERTWTQLANPTNTMGERAQAIAVSGAGRFVRLRSQATAVNFHAGDLLRELEVYASNDAAAPNLASRRTVKTSSYGTPWPGGHEAAKAVDGDSATSWANDYRSRRVVFRNNVALVTANPIKIGTGADYAGEDITWEDHDVIDAGFLNEEGLTGGGMMNFSHYNYDHTPHEMAMTRIRVRRARFEDVVGFMQVGWYFHRTNKNFWFATRLEAEFEDITIDHVHPGMTLFQILLHQETGCARLKFTNLQIGGRMIRSLDDLTAAGVTVDLRGVNDDDRIEFVVRP